MYQLPRNPTVRDNAGFQIGDFWINEINNDLWYLAKKSNAPQYQDALWVQLGGGDVESLTGDVGGPVFPDVNGNINTLGTTGQVTVTGNPGTNTLTWSLDGSIATEYVCNTDSAIPAGGILNVLGNTYINTIGFGNTIEIDVTGNIAAQYPTDAGTAVPVANTLNIFGGTAGRDINTTGVGDTVRVELNNAISLGDLSTIAANGNALTIDSGDINMTASQNSATTNQKIKMSGGQISFFLNNAFVGKSVGNTTMTPGVAIFNYAFGAQSMTNVTTATQNGAFGNGALQALTTGQNNDCFGYTTGNRITTGSDNAAFGGGALGNGTAGVGLKTGSYNCALGTLAGVNYNGAESSNIQIGSHNTGVLGESNVLRIGNATGTGVGQLNYAFIHGIRGITTGVNDAIAVLIDSAGQLGTVSSSKRYKENIVDMDSSSEAIYKLRPVNFNYINDCQKSLRYGLIAEEVAETFPYLAAGDGQGGYDSVKYHELAVILLNEVQKLNKRVAELEAR